MKKQKYAGLLGNKNRTGKTKPEEKLRSSIFAIPLTQENKALLVTAADGQKLTDVYRPVLIKYAKRLLKKKAAK